ncbi:hypothetical protein ACFTZB_32455 [Rhodococcus sp. NPDC057014]|uniref:hypothetical protein n=1 Tax=Rhodococcus sp. NPDC057014 TaxID=3346000 RepID=UPI003625779F
MDRIACIPVDTPGLFRIRRPSGQIVETVVVAKYVRLGAMHGHGLCDFLVRYQEREVTVSELKREWGEDSVELMDAARFIEEWARDRRERRGSV